MTDVTVSAGPSPDVATVKASSLASLQNAVNDASSRAGTLWLSFLTFMAYLTMTVGAVTHEALLLEKPIKLPVLNVDLPLVGFFWIAPLFFLLFHFYLFLQLVILVRKSASFEQILQADVVDESEREEYRKRLDSFLVLQFLCGAKEERSGMTGRLLRAVAVITLVMLPILLLLQFQLTFLPYHDAWVTWIHRFAILIDIRLAWVFWFAIRKGDGEISFPELQPQWLAKALSWQSLREVPHRGIMAFRSAWRGHWIGTVSSVSVIFISFFVLSFKDETVSRLIRVPVPVVANEQLTWELQSISEVLLHGPINMVEGRPKVWFSNVLVVPDKKLVKEADAETEFPSLSLRGRNLSGAILVGSDLRNVDFTGANLNDARLDRALLTRAKFRCAASYERRPKEPGWPGDECSWLQGATFLEAQLQAADFDRARMHGAILIGANLIGAQLTGTQLQGAMLVNAQLQAALIQGASLKGAFLNGAVLVGAKITRTDLQDMVIGDTIFQLTYLEFDKSKVRWLRELNFQEESTVDETEAMRKENSRIADQFLHAEIKRRPSQSHSENVEAAFDLGRLTKLRQDAITQMAAANKTRLTDFRSAYSQAEETEWDSVRETVRKATANGTAAAARNIKDYTIGFACNVGSSPHVTRGLIRGEAIMWILNKLVELDRSGSEALEVLDHLRAGVSRCPGSKDLKQSEIAAIDYMRLKVFYAIKEKEPRAASEPDVSKPVTNDPSQK